MNVGSMSGATNPSTIDKSGIRARVQSFSQASQPVIVSEKVNYKEITMSNKSTESVSKKNLGKSNNFDQMMAAQQAVTEMLRNEHLAKVAKYKDEKPELKKVLFKGEVAGHNMTVREHSVFINDDAKRGVDHIVHGEVESAAFLGAISMLHTRPASGKYKILEVGLYSLKDPNTFAAIEAEAFVVTASFAPVAWMPKEVAEKFMDVKPATGMNIVAWKQGNLKVHKNIPDVPAIDERMTFEQNHAAIYQYKFYVALDMIQSGKKVEVAPYLRNHVVGEDGRWAQYANGKWAYEKAPERVEAMIRTYAKAFSVPPEEAVVIVANNIEASVSKKVNYALYKKSSTMVTTGLDLWSHPIKVDGEIVTFKDLAGRTLQMKRHGNPCGLVAVTEEKLAYLCLLVQPDMQRTFSII